MKLRAPWLERIRQRLLASDERLGMSRRITLAALILTALMVISVGLASLGIFYGVLRQKMEAELVAESRLVQRHFDGDLNSIVSSISELAKSSFISNGLTDSADRDNYLLPLLREYKLPVRHQVKLVLFDYRGRPVASNTQQSQAIMPDPSVLQQTMQSSQARSLLQERSVALGGPVLQLLYPIIFPPSGQAEGLLLAELNLMEIFHASTGQMDAKFHSDLLPHPLPNEALPQWQGHIDDMQRAWPARLLPPLDGLGLWLRIGQSRSSAFAPLYQMLLSYGAFSIIMLVLALYLARRMGRYLALPITRLNRTASEIASNGSFDIEAKVSGHDEVASLARTFNLMLSRLRASHNQLQLREAEMKELLENSPDLIVRFDRHLRCAFVNRMAQSHLGRSPDLLLGKAASEFGFDTALQDALESLLSRGGEYAHEFSRDGRYFEGRFVAEYGGFSTPVGQVTSLLAIIRDVSARRLAEESLHLANRAIESSVVPIIIASCLENDYPIKYVNPAFERVTGYTAAQALGHNARFLRRDDADQPEYERLRLAMAERKEVQVVVRNYRQDGTLFWNELNLSPVTDSSGVVTHFIGEINDITARREQQLLLHQASHDVLTGLPNRSLLEDRLSQALGFAQRYCRQVVVAFIDLDKFKFINDSMGHGVGDQLLVQVALRLNESVRDSDTVARIGGDEFVVLLFDQANEDATFSAMQRMLRSISQPMLLAGHETIITCSIGFAVYPQDGEDASTLLKNADAAMYRAKELGRDNFQFFTKDMHSRINERMALEAGLRTAIEHDELVLHYQPQVDLRTGKVSGLEALIRWNHPTLGQVAPIRFIPLAEEIGLIRQIGDWVLHCACRQQVAWLREGLGDIRIAVNVSASQFMHKDFPAGVARVIQESGIAPGSLELEITESLSMQDPQATIRVLHELRQMGIKLAIDDFGTGYSNLSYLKLFPVDRLKLDQTFVRDVAHSADDLAIADAVIAMAHSLGLGLVAEGVEHAAQLAMLADHGCDEMQGYYFSPALPANACAALLREGRILPLQALKRSRAPRTLLLVDDEANILAALERTLRQSSNTILRANSAGEAFEVMAQHEVAVILCDQRMPGMTGVEFFSQIRLMYPRSVRIILSGYADLQAVTDAINLGAVYRFLNKPWDADELNAVINTAFDVYDGSAHVQGLHAETLDVGVAPVSPESS